MTKAAEHFCVHDDGVPVWYAPGDSVPAKHAKLVSNQAVLEGGDGGGSGGSTDSEIPPKGGAGSGKEAWADYAKANGVDVPDDATRDDIIAALDKAGVPTEQQ
jgi:hypothetical protein